MWFSSPNPITNLSLLTIDVSKLSLRDILQKYWTTIQNYCGLQKKVWQSVTVKRRLRRHGIWIGCILNEVLEAEEH